MSLRKPWIGWWLSPFSMSAADKPHSLHAHNIKPDSCWLIRRLIRISFQQGHELIFFRYQVSSKEGDKEVIEILLLEVLRTYTWIVQSWVSQPVSVNCSLTLHNEHQVLCLSLHSSFSFFSMGNKNHWPVLYVIREVALPVVLALRSLKEFHSFSRWRRNAMPIHRHSRKIFFSEGGNPSLSAAED